MNEQYFDKEYIRNFDRTFWFMWKLRIFGKRIIEHSGPYKTVWYVHEGKLYLADYRAL